MTAYKVLIILEEIDDISGETEENVDFAETLGVFDDLAPAADLIRRTVAQTEV